VRFTDTAEQVRRELRHIEGAIRHEPQHRDRGGGEEPRNAVPLWNPNRATGHQLAEAEPVSSSGEEVEHSREFVDAVASPAAEAELSAAIAAIGEDEDRRIREQVAIDGVDALGWYATMHQDACQWGVYLKAEGALWLAGKVFLPVTKDPVLAVRLAVRAVHDHELMHFAEDWAIAQLELLFDRACWWPIRESKNFTRIGVSSERLANGYMLRRARTLPGRLKCRHAYAALGEWTLTQGDGYREGSELVGTQRKFDEACRDHLSTAFASDEGLPWVGQAELHRLYPLGPHVDWRYCPVQVVAGTPGLAALISSLFIRQLPQVEETERFQRMLAGLHGAEQRAWLKTRTQLAQTTQLKGLDFKPWTPRGQDWFSVRVSKGTRAHLRFDSPSQRWFAEEIGPHKALGHG
jgi:hypothetical protein